MNRDCPYNGSPPFPSKGPVASPVTAIRYEESGKSLLNPRQVIKKNVFGNNDDDDEASEINATTTSLFQQSVRKLGPLGQPSFSFSSDISDGTTDLLERRSLGVLSSRLPSGATRRMKGNRSVTHSTTTSSTAQIQVHKIVGEAQEINTRRMHCVPISPTSGSSNSEETSTDISSNVDLDTVARVSHFIDSLLNKSEVMPQTQSCPISPNQVGTSLSVPAMTDSSQCLHHAEITTRYQSSLANARNAMAASPIAKSFTSRSEPMLRGTNCELGPALADRESLDEASHVQARIECYPFNEARCQTTPSNLLETLPKNKIPGAMVSLVKPNGDPQVSTDSQMIRRDIHYYAILAQIQKVVRSDNASMSLGKILADANKRGMSLDVVTEIYKKERFKATSQKAMYIDNKEMASPGMTCLGRLEVFKHEEVDRDDMKRDPSEQTSSSSSLQELEDIDPSEWALLSPLQKELEDGNAQCDPPDLRRHLNIKSLIPPEMARIELTLQCDQETALFNENVMEEESYVSAEADVETKVTTSQEKLSSGVSVEYEVNSVEDAQVEIKDEAGPDNLSGNFLGHHAVPLADNESTPTFRAGRQLFDSPRSQQTAEATPKLNAGIRPSEVSVKARKEGLPPNKLVGLFKKECLRANRSDINDASTLDDTIKHGEPSVHDVEQIFSHSEIPCLIEKLKTPNGNEYLEKGHEHCEGDFGISGLNELQLRQLKHLVKKGEELREADVPPQVCIDDAIKLSLGYTEYSESAPTLSVSGRRDIAMLEHEDIDAFCSRFSIQEDGEPTKSGRKVGLDTECRGKDKQSFYPEPSSTCKGESGDAECESQECLSKIVSKNSGVQSDHLEEASYGAELLQFVEDQRTAETEWKSKQQYHPGDGRNKLPKHLGLWKSPWQRNHIASSNGSHIFKPDLSAGIATDGTFSKKSCGGKQRQCFLPLDQRATGHTGYLNIDFYSLYEATVVQSKDEDIDQAPWEYRDVGQRFLHEKSLESRNWFGSFEIKRGNDRVPNPVCRPKSIEVSVTKIPKPGAWSQDWYTTWKSRRDNPNNLVTLAQDETMKMSESQSFVNSSMSNCLSPIIVKKVAVEIGSLCPVRVRGGEHISRIHPEFTSSLRQSRWRKKYLKGSLFPTD